MSKQSNNAVANSIVKLLNSLPKGGSLSPDEIAFHPTVNVSKTAVNRLIALSSRVNKLARQGKISLPLQYGRYPDWFYTLPDQTIVPYPTAGTQLIVSPTSSGAVNNVLAVASVSLSVLRRNWSGTPTAFHNATAGLIEGVTVLASDAATLQETQETLSVVTDALNRAKKTLTASNQNAWASPAIAQAA